MYSRCSQWPLLRADTKRGVEVLDSICSKLGIHSLQITKPSWGWVQHVQVEHIHCDHVYLRLDREITDYCIVIRYYTMSHDWYVWIKIHFITFNLCQIQINTTGGMLYVLPYHTRLLLTIHYSFTFQYLKVDDLLKWSKNRYRMCLPHIKSISLKQYGTCITCKMKSYDLSYF